MRVQPTPLPTPLGSGLLVLLALAGSDAHLLRGQPQADIAYREAQYTCRAEPGFQEKCVTQWQDACRKIYNHSEELRGRLCETQLKRNYVRIRTLIPPSDLLDHWRWDFERRKFDEGFFRSHLPKFTDTGFKLTRLPDRLHERVLAWYNRSRNRSRPESSQPAFGIHCNTGHDNDDWVVSLDFNVFEEVHEWIREQLVEWTGQDVNEPVSTYGARQYHRGSICGMHTDNTETHAFSAIYQLDQQGMDEPWGLDYVTHRGEEGRAFMRPGDVMLYESASGLHGRKAPLMGDEFTNIFVHFRSPEWLPSVKKQMAEYWPLRQRFEEHHQRLTSIGDAPPRERLWRSTDQCIPARSRSAPLLVEGGYMTTPGDPTLDL